MTKKEYIRAINVVKKMSRDADGVNKALQKFSPDFGGFGLGYIETEYVRLIELAVGDKVGSWTGYFIYDLDFGKEAKRYEVTDQYGKKWILDTPGKVYDLINLK